MPYTWVSDKFTSTQQPVKATDQTRQVRGFQSCTLVDSAGRPLYSDFTNPAIETQLKISLKEPGGSSNMAVDGSGTPVEFSAAPASNECFTILDIAYILQDTKISAGGYGGISALTNGTLLEKWIGGGAVKIGLPIDELPLKTNRQIASHENRNPIVDFDGTEDMLNVHILPLELFGGYLYADGANSESIVATVRDNLSTINFHEVYLIGRRRIID